VSVSQITQSICVSSRHNGGHDNETRSLLTKYIQPLPFPGAGIVVATPSGLNQYAFTQREIARQLHPDLPPTPFWAYDDGSGLGGQAGSFGMALVAESGTALDVTFTNDVNPESRQGRQNLGGTV
jgi:hypothetical protein